MDCTTVVFGHYGNVDECYTTPASMICGQVFSVRFTGGTYTVFCYPSSTCGGGDHYWPNLKPNTCYTGKPGDLVNGLYMEIGEYAAENAENMLVSNSKPLDAVSI
jgi:hypothetical protein